MTDTLNGPHAQAERPAEPTSKQFTRDVFAWLDQVFADPEIPPSGFKLAFAISQHVNRKTGKAWPSQKTLGDEIGISDRATRTMLDRLRARGHLSIEVGHGPGQSSKYRMLQNRKPTSAIDHGKPEANFRISDADTGSPVHENRKSTSANTGSQLPPNYLNEPSEEPSESKTSLPRLISNMTRRLNLHPRRILPRRF